MRPDARAFTLIELLVVIAIIGILSSVVLASLNQARQRGRVAAGQQFAGHVAQVRGAGAIFLADLDEGTGTGVQDKATGRTGTMSGTVSWVDGLIRKGLFFDGSGAVTFPSGTLLPLDESYSFTVTAWVNPSDAASNRTVVGGRYSETFWFGLDAGRVVLRLDDASMVSSGTVPVGEWTNIAVSYDKDTKIGTFYINGTAVGESLYTDSDGSSIPPSLFLGTEGRFAYAFFGSIDEVRIYEGKMTD